MYGSTRNKRMGSSTSPLLGQPIATKADRDRRKQFRDLKKQQSSDGSTPVFSQLFKQTTRSNTSHHELHSYLYTALNPRSHQPQAILFKKIMALVIVVDMILFIISTEPQFETHELFVLSEAFASCLFFVEYVARLFVVTEGKRYSKLGPVLGRLRYMVTPMAIIDAFATFPFFIELVTGFALPTLTYLRFFRLLRLTKTDQFAKSMDACARVLYYNRQILYVAMFLCIFLVLFTSVLLYYLRPPGKNEDFQSIPATMYMSTLLLTGQGGPDATDLPWYTKGIILATGVFSVAMFAIPASMLTWGFEAEAERLAVKTRRRARKQMEARLTGRPYSCHSDSSIESDWSSSSMDTSDEEYQKIIAGEGDEEGGDETGEAAILKELLQVFENADADGSDSLSKEEFLSIITGKLREASQRVGPSSPDDSFDRGPVVSMKKAMASPDSLVDRMDSLEAKVDAMDATLGRILELVESKRW